MSCLEKIHFTAKVISVSKAFGGGESRIEIAVEDECDAVKALYADLILPAIDCKDAKVGDVWWFICGRSARAEDLLPEPKNPRDCT